MSKAPTPPNIADLQARRIENNCIDFLAQFGISKGPSTQPKSTPDSNTVESLEAQEVSAWVDSFYKAAKKYSVSSQSQKYLSFLKRYNLPEGIDISKWQNYLVQLVNDPNANYRNDLELDEGQLSRGLELFKEQNVIAILYVKSAFIAVVQSISGAEDPLVPFQNLEVQQQRAIVEEIFDDFLLDQAIPATIATVEALEPSDQPEIGQTPELPTNVIQLRVLSIVK